MLLMIGIHLMLFVLSDVESAGILYPRTSESRELLSLDGLWKFALTNSSDPVKRHVEWYNIDFRAVNDSGIRTMPVPASYNDLETDSFLRDYVGPVWYQRSFFVPKSWDGQKVWVRFSSVCISAEVWVNGNWSLSHDIGHLPFQAEISSVLNYGRENTITVQVDNTLTRTSIPQGSVVTLESGRRKQKYNYDFFNYAGIDRPVVLYTTPLTYIDDITVSTDLDGVNGFVNYSIAVEGSEEVTVKVTLVDKTGTEIVSDTALESSLFVQNASFWWPYLMDPNPGYLYTLQVQLLNSSDDLIDKYVLPIGIRKVTWDSKSLKINDKPIYLRGFGRHEDSDIRGKGLDLPLIIRDHNLIKWIGANSYRTSHYPYAEEIMDFADKLGIMIIDEAPAVAPFNFDDELLKNHMKSLNELMQRDKNRPSVIIWSAANEPLSQNEESADYFKQIVAYMKTLDTSRPITAALHQLPDNDHAGEFFDIISCNTYYGWYKNVGDLDRITPQVLEVARRWHEMHNVPVIQSEYGADTLEGLHLLPSFAWSEEYQNDVLSKYFEAFDQLRDEDFFIGEFIWNFADFKTAQKSRRVGGNKKGVFTRNRQPKASAHFLRKRYWELAEQLDNAEVPDDVNLYSSGSSSAKN